TLTRENQERSLLVEADRGKAVARRAEATTVVERATLRFEQQGTQRDTLVEKRHRGQAALLARELEQGGPCPVCGSSDHPAPAQAQDDLPSDSALDDAEANLEMARENLKNSQSILSKAEEETTRLNAKVDALREALGENRDIDVDVLRKQEQDAIRERNQSEEAADRLPRLERGETDALAALTAAEKTLTQQRERREKAAAELEAARQVEASILGSLPPDIRTAEALEAAILQASTTLDQRVQALEDTRTGFEKARNEHQVALARHQATKEQHATAAERDQDSEVELEKSIAEEGFDGRQDFLDARRTDEAMEALDMQIREWTERRTRIAARLEAARKDTEGLTDPDIPALETAARSANEDHEASLQELGRVSKEIEDLENTRTRLIQIEEEQSEDTRSKQLVGRLSRAANGDNGANLSFERFVLAALLEEVLVQATSRLQTMSNGRYTLHRATGSRDLRKKGGLDLEVLDAQTGRSRPVSTLSGGEGFAASLALALGLADIVQSQTGGTHLDAIFVDEGFGTLGEEDLDAVMSALQDLRKGGRLVGIISHVRELADRIPVRLEVHRGSKGSHTEFLLN
ncbi:MAG: SbcC/MukB-like Walker B domain-containing protein, partial [Myxococcota bacterium]|nr:SbcC/MukB-like Walker B domain-containing protein [Myxococcota bacterium]